MLRVFGPTDTDYTSNGDVVLRPIKAKVHKEDNGAYYLDIETGFDYVDYLVGGNLIIANTPQGNQAFRISSVQKTRTKLTARCNHVFYDSMNYLIASATVPRGKTCEEALQIFNGATDPASVFTIDTFYRPLLNLEPLRASHQSLYDAFMMCLECWGGHLVRDNFTVSIPGAIGHDNGITIEYKKNLREITCQEDWADVCTKIMPIGKDGVMLNTLDPTASPYMSSETQYTIPYTKAVQFSQEGIVREDYPSDRAYMQALILDLGGEANQYLKAHSKPAINYTVKAHINHTLDVGDIIVVKDERLGINIDTAVIMYEYDCILERYTEVELGSRKKGLADFSGEMRLYAKRQTQENTALDNSIISVKSDITTITSNVGNISGDVSDINNVLTSYNVIYEGTQILVVESLPKSQAGKVMKIDKDGISFSSSGINGTFTTKWSINGKLTMGVSNGKVVLGNEYTIECLNNNDTLVFWVDGSDTKCKALVIDGKRLILNNDHTVTWAMI